MRPLPTLRSLFPYTTVYESSQRRLLLLHDVHFSYATTIQELSLRLRTLRASQPYPRPGERLTLQVAIPSQAGRPFAGALALADRPGIPLRQAPGSLERLALAPDALFFLSFGIFTTALDAAGNATLPLVIPNDAALWWLPLFAAGFTLQPGPEPVGAITNGVELEIVR